MSNVPVKTGYPTVGEVIWGVALDLEIPEPSAADIERHQADCDEHEAMASLWFGIALACFAVCAAWQMYYGTAAGLAIITGLVFWRFHIVATRYEEFVNRCRG